MTMMLLPCSAGPAMAGRLASKLVAEEEGFEPPIPLCGITVFKTAAFNRSATPPRRGLATSVQAQSTVLQRTRGSHCQQ